MDVIAVVTGASRGAGKGIAIALGETGATVYVTGRSTADGDSPYGGTVTETAGLITRAGGKGVAIALDHTGHYGSVAYYHGPAYGAQKAGADKMAADFAKELRPHNIAAVSIWMGGLDTERARAYLASMPDESRPKTKRDSPQFTGKVIAALYESNLRMELSGRALIGAELGAKLGVSDIDGSAPKSYRYELGGPPELHATLTS